MPQKNCEKLQKNQIIFLNFSQTMWDWPNPALVFIKQECQFYMGMGYTSTQNSKDLSLFLGIMVVLSWVRLARFGYD